MKGCRDEGSGYADYMCGREKVNEARKQPRGKSNPVSSSFNNRGDDYYYYDRWGKKVFSFNIMGSIKRRKN